MLQKPLVPLCSWVSTSPRDDKVETVQVANLGMLIRLMERRVLIFPTSTKSFKNSKLENNHEEINMSVASHFRVQGRLSKSFTSSSKTMHSKVLKTNVCMSRSPSSTKVPIKKSMRYLGHKLACTMSPVNHKSERIDLTDRWRTLIKLPLHKGRQSVWSRKVGVILHKKEGLSSMCT